MDAEGKGDGGEHKEDATSTADIDVIVNGESKGPDGPSGGDGGNGDGGNGGNGEAKSDGPPPKAQFTSVSEGVAVRAAVDGYADAAAGSDSGGVGWNGEGKAPEAFHRAGYRGRISISERDQLLRKCVSTMYQTITKRRGPMAVFFGAHLDDFDDDDEHKLVYTALHKEFETLLDQALTAFAHEEGFAGPRELYAELQDAVADGGTKAEKMLNMICAAADYGKFVRLMKNKARSQRKLEANQSTIYGSTYGASGASSSAISGAAAAAGAAAKK